MAAETLRRTLRYPSGSIGAAILLIIILIAVFGPLFAPHSPNEQLGLASAAPTHRFPLGTDYLGRDVLSRMLSGGRSVLYIGVSATLAAYLIGATLGIFAGYRGGWKDGLTMRGLDVILAFPPLLVLLLLASGAGRHVWVLILGVVIVQVPAIARIARTSALTVSKLAFIEAAQARGDSTLTIWRKDVTPNILPTLLADFGVRFSISIVLVASMNFLGLGLTPPASDWGLMMSENQAAITLNPQAVIGPAVMLALLTVSINLVADAYIRAANGGTRSPRAWRRRRALQPPVERHLDVPTGPLPSGSVAS